MEALQAVLAFVGEDPEVNAMWVVRFTSIQFVSCSLHKRAPSVPFLHVPTEEVMHKAKVVCVHFGDLCSEWLTV